MKKVHDMQTLENLSSSQALKQEVPKSCFLGICAKNVYKEDDDKDEEMRVLERCGREQYVREEVPRRQ